MQLFFNIGNRSAKYAENLLKILAVVLTAIGFLGFEAGAFFPTAIVAVSFYEAGSISEFYRNAVFLHEDGAGYNTLIYITYALLFYPIKLVGALPNVVETFNRFGLDTVYYDFRNNLLLIYYIKTIHIGLMAASIWLFANQRVLRLRDYQKELFVWIAATSPLFFYVVLIHNLFEPLAVFFGALSLFLLGQSRFFLFGTALAISTIFKSLILFVLLPLALLKNPSRQKFFISTIGFLVVWLIFVVSFQGIDGYGPTQHFVTRHVAKLFNSPIFNIDGFANFTLFPICFMACLAYLFAWSPDTSNDAAKIVLATALLIVWAFFSSVWWHPNYFILVWIPLTFVLMRSPRRVQLYFVEFALFVCIVAFAAFGGLAMKMWVCS